MRGFRTMKEREAIESARSPSVRGFAPGRGAAFAQAQNQAPDSIPAMMKPGEFVLPPDTVHAMGGPQALQDVVNATHAPVARGFAPRAMREEPRQFFANGGLVEDENPKRPNSFGDAAAAAQDAGVTRVGGLANGDASANRIEQVPAAVGMQPDPAAPPPPARGLAPNVQPAQPAEQPTTSSAVRGFAPASLSTAAPGEPAAAPTSGNVTRVGNSYSGGNVGGEITVNGNTPGGGSVVADGQKTRGFTPASGGAAAAPNNWNDTIAKVEAMGFKQRPAQPLGEPGVATAVAEGGAGAGRGFVNPAPAQPGTAQAQQAAADAGKQTIPGVYQHGRGQYSDNASGMGLPAGFTGQPSAQNQAAADNLVRGFTPGGGAAPAPSTDTVRGFVPAGISAPTVRHSGNDWQARNDLRNAQVSASSITQSDKWGKGRDRTATANYAALLRADQAARGAQPGLDQEAMRQNGGLQREAMQQTGETSRTRLQQALADIRERRAAGQQATQNDLARQRLALDTARASRDGVPTGYRPRSDGAGLEAIPGGPADKPRDAKLTEDQAKAAGYAVRMQNALSQLDSIGKENPGATRPGAGTALLNMLPEGAANMMRPEGRQRVEAAQLDALDAALTLNTGAAYTREQLQGLSRSYFAQPGDSDKVAAEKQLRLGSLIETARLRAGPQGGQMADAAIGRAQQGMATPGQQRIVTRTGALNGRRVVQYSDGSISYAD